MPSNKTLVTMIFCFAVVVSVWLISRNSSTNPTLAAIKTLPSVSTEPREEIGTPTDTSWKNILTTVTQNSEPVVDLTQNNTSDDTFDGTTVTAQMSQDFMSKYLAIKETGQDVSPDNAQAIANSVLSNQMYTNPGPVYVQSNLNITNNTDTATVTNYRTTVNAILKARSTQVTSGPVALLNNALSANNSDLLTRLSSVISIGTAMIQDLMGVQVPKDAVSVHLELINATSNLTHSIEAMQATFSDPVRAYVGINQYNQDMVNFQNALKDMNFYFIQKLGSAT